VKQREYQGADAVQLKLTLYDEYGDGWNGAILTISASGDEPITSTFWLEGAGDKAEKTVKLAPGQTYSIGFADEGYYPSEVSYEVEIVGDSCVGLFSEGADENDFCQLELDDARGAAVPDAIKDRNTDDSEYPDFKNPCCAVFGAAPCNGRFELVTTETGKIKFSASSHTPAGFDVCTDMCSGSTATAGVLEINGDTCEDWVVAGHTCETISTLFGGDCGADTEEIACSMCSKACGPPTSLRSCIDEEPETEGCDDFNFMLFLVHSADPSNWVGGASSHGTTYLDGEAYWNCWDERGIDELSNPDKAAHFPCHDLTSDQYSQKPLLPFFAVNLRSESDRFLSDVWLTEAATHCTDSASLGTPEHLKDAPEQLVQDYYECQQTASAAAFSSLSISFANATAAQEMLIAIVVSIAVALLMRGKKEKMFLKDDEIEEANYEQARNYWLAKDAGVATSANELAAKVKRLEGMVDVLSRGKEGLMQKFEIEDGRFETTTNPMALNGSTGNGTGQSRMV